MRQIEDIPESFFAKRSLIPTNNTKGKIKKLMVCLTDQCQMVGLTLINHGHRVQLKPKKLHKLVELPCRFFPNGKKQIFNHFST